MALSEPFDVSNKDFLDQMFEVTGGAAVLSTRFSSKRYVTRVTLTHHTFQLTISWPQCLVIVPKARPTRILRDRISKLVSPTQR